MTLKSHVIAAVVGGAVAYPFIGFGYSLLFAASSILIDADHYLDFLWRNDFTDWSPKRMFRYYDLMTKKEGDYLGKTLPFALLHTVEMFLVVYALALYVNYPFFMVIIAGMAYHIIFDIVWLTSREIPFIRPYSITEYFIRKKIMKKDGIDPEAFPQHLLKLTSENARENDGEKQALRA